ncbi:MAG: hypothetical protein JRI39_06755 [Deltaproteobacteria bacterium]|nr:hypothetical protein [Deltaproteobacteria bacterium]
MKQRLSQKDAKSKGQKAVTVKEQFTGRNLTRFGGAGLIKRFFKRHRIEQMLDKKIKEKAAGHVSTVSALCLWDVCTGCCWAIAGHTR